MRKTERGELFMKIRTPKIVRKMACKYLSKVIEEETGIRTNICIENLTINTKGPDYTIYMEETVCINKKDLRKFIKESMKKES